MNPQHYYIGIMSGTSMDGVDTVLIRMNDDQWDAALGHYFIPYSSDLRTRLLDLQNIGYNELHRAHLLSIELTELYSQAVQGILQQSSLKASDIRAIGCHGQTIRHAPNSGYTIQLVDLALLAQRTGIFTIGDFRSGDMAAGGQGAPLVPSFHHALFAQADRTRVLLNIGGIANISVLPSHNEPFGFDTGAGNMLMDAWAQAYWQQSYDKNGTIAQQGNVLPELLAQLCAHEYFRQPFPKSTGRELFSLAWLQTHLHGNEQPEDVMRTLVQFTIDTIILGITTAAPQLDALFICGGGVHHPLLMQGLNDYFNARHVAVSTTDALNLNPQQVEAAAFAWFAHCWCEQRPSNPIRATGAHKNVILGAGYFA